MSTEENIVRRERLLIVDQYPEKLVDYVKNWLLRYDISILIAKTGIEALEKYKLYSPALIILNAELPDMSGMSVSSIIKDGENGRQTSVILFNLEGVFQNTKADFFFTRMDEQSFSDLMQAQLKTFYDERFLKAMHSQEIQMAQHRQYQLLPETIFGKQYTVLNFFSAFSSGLSGDGFDYWQDAAGKNLYGLLFDCTGHDITAFSQVNSLRSFLKKDMKLFELGFYKTLPEVLESVNGDLFAIDSSPEMTAAIVFELDVEKQKFHYCTAGIPGLILKDRKNAWQTTEEENYLLGCYEKAEFKDAVIDLGGIDEIICCSDGFFELAFHNEEVKEDKIAKHDDVSAIVIQRRKEA